jgi:hypothetical protein
MSISLTLDLKTIIVIFAILIMIFMIFSETSNDMKIYKKINKEPRRLLIKNPHAIHPMPLPVPKPFAMPFPVQSNAALMGGLRIHERD